MPLHRYSNFQTITYCEKSIQIGNTQYYNGSDSKGNTYKGCLTNRTR